MRATILERLWLENEEALYITKQEFMACYVDWDISPQYTGDVMVAATIIKGPEFHFARFTGDWTLTRADIRRYLEPILAQYGCVTTRVPKEDTRMARFIRILGFVPTGEDEFYIHNKLEQLPFKNAGGASCRN